MFVPTLLVDTFCNVAIPFEAWIVFVPLIPFPEKVTSPFIPTPLLSVITAVKLKVFPGFTVFGVPVIYNDVAFVFSQTRSFKILIRWTSLLSIVIVLPSFNLKLEGSVIYSTRKILI